MRPFLSLYPCRSSPARAYLSLVPVLSHALIIIIVVYITRRTLVYSSGSILTTTGDKNTILSSTPIIWTCPFILSAAEPNLYNLVIREMKKILTRISCTVPRAEAAQPIVTFLGVVIERAGQLNRGPTLPHYHLQTTVTIVQPEPIKPFPSPHTSTVVSSGPSCHH